MVSSLRKAKIGFVMDHIAPRDGDFEVDLESGRTTSEDNVTTGGENGLDLCDNVLNSGGVYVENVKVVIDKKLDGGEVLSLEEKKRVKEKRKKSSNKKPLKPPRPPNGPSLYASDQKLIREISELAMLKRARIERMKKMKATKTSSTSNGSLLAMVFTILFCLVIFYQEMCPQSSAPVVSFQEVPESAAKSSGGLISVQYHRNISAKDSSGLDSGSPGLVEQVSGLNPQEKESRLG